MSFTVDDFHDLVQLLEERQDWRAEIRRLVLTDEFLALPEQIVELRRETAELRRDTEEQFRSVRQEIAELRQQAAELQRETAELRRDVNALDRRVRTLTDDVGELKGDSLERRYRERGPAYFGRMIRRTHVLAAEEVDALLTDAVDRGLLAEADKDEVNLADLVVRGRSRGEDADVFLVVEVSTQVEPHDVQRAVRRAELLAQLGSPAWPVVAGHGVTESATRLIRAKPVWQLLDGSVIRPVADVE